MKRLFCMLLVAAMLLGFMPAVALQASAADSIGIEELVLSDLPEELVPGPAQAPNVEVLDGEAEVVQVQWRINEMDAATTLLADQAYFLAITLKPKDGYYFEEWLGIKANREEYMSTYEDGQQRTVFYRYSLLEDAGEIKAWINQPYEGMDIADLTCIVEGNAVLDGIYVYDENADQMMEEGVFGPLNNYQITYSLRAKPGYEFADHGDLEVNDGEKYVEWYAEDQDMSFWAYFSTCQPIDTVEMSLGTLALGMALDAVELTVDPDAPYVVNDAYVYAYGDSTSEVFENGENYELSFNLRAKEGYVFSENVCGYINGEAVSFWTYGSGTHANGWMEIAFGVDSIYLSGMPYEIQPGEAELPEPECNDQVKITDVKWVDANKQKVTAFEDGKVYYLAVTLEPTGIRSFGQEPEVEMDSTGAVTTFEKLTDKKAVVYIRYSLEPAVEAVDVTVSGVEAGKPVDGITVTVNGNATYVEAVIMECIPQSEDSYNMKPLDSDVFEAGKIYIIECYLQPGEGYRFSYETKYTVNGEAFENWGERGQQCMLDIIMDTCKKIDTVKLTMDDIKVGKAFSDLQAKVPAGANYTATTYWYDTTNDQVEATGKVQAGHRYEARVVLEAKDGYVFAKGATATLNGDKFEIYSELTNRYAWGWVEKSFLTSITKVELPAMPTSIQKNKELPVATVSGKNYTLRVYWGLMGGDEKTVADEDGTYLLVWSAEVKDGYEFTDDTRFYIGGKEVRPLERGWRDGQFLQSYSIGIPTVERVDLICQEPKAGQEPPEVTVPDGTQYYLSQVMWGQNATHDWYDIDETADVLHNGLYTYIGGMIAVAEGTALDTNAVFYINGEKMTPAAFYNFGQYAIVLFDLGKLGEIEKLTAPELSKDGEVLSWNAVLNATGYEIYRATSKSGKYTKVATVTDTTWQDSVTAGKTYYYKVKAVYSVDSSKSSGYSGYVSIAYKCAEPAITVVNGSSGKPVISWEKISGAKKYTVYRATSETGKYSKLETTTKLTYTDSKAAAGNEYFYKVLANASSSSYNSGYSNVESCFVICGTPSVTLKNDTATGKPVLSWSKISGAVKYEVYLLGAEDYVVLGTVTGTSFKDDSCYAGEGRYYGVRAIAAEEACNSEVGEPVFGRAACAQPKVTGATNSDGKPVLTWAPVEGAAQYEIYRSTKSTKSYSLLITVETPSYVDESVAGGKTYYYKVVAVGENCKSAESAYVKLTGKCAAPVITVVNGDSGKPVISWAKVGGAKKYTIYRATAADGKYKSIGSTKSLSYTDTKATAGSEYFYKVIANGSKSTYNSIYSNIYSSYVICGTPSVTIKVDAATGKPSLSWGKVTGAVEYIILRQLDGEETFTELTRVTGTSFKDETAPIDTRCQYRVQALGEHEMLNGAYSKVVEATSAIAQPKLQSGINDQGKPHFSWAPIEGAVKYEIYRSTKSTKSYTLLATVVDGNAYVDETVAPGKTYYYKVVAIGAVSKSAESAYVKLTGKCATPELFVENAESGKPYLKWYKVSGAKKYTIYRATSETGKYTKLGTTTKIEYIDTKAAAGKIYFYKIVANASSSKYSSGYSNIVSCGVTCAAPTVKVTNNADGIPVVSWSKVTGAVGYKVTYQFGYLGGGEPPIYDVYLTGTSYTFEDLTADMFGWVEVTAIAADEAYNSQPAMVEAEVIPATPKLTGKVGTNGKPVISWEDCGDAVIYEIYRSTKSGSGYKLIGEVDCMGEFTDFVPEYEDTTAVKGKTYYYKVVARSWNSESKESAPVKIKSK